MKGTSLLKAILSLTIFLLTSAFYISPALATVPQQAKGAISSSGSGNTRHAEDNDLTRFRFIPEGYTGYTSNWISILNLHSGAQRASLQCRDADGYAWWGYRDCGALGSSTCRRAINLNTFVPSGRSVCTKVWVNSGRVMAERVTYKGYEANSSSGYGQGHRAIYLSEGYTGHDVYISVRNCGSAPRLFYFSFRDESGAISPTRIIPVAGYCRGTIKINDYVSGARSVSTVVYASDNADVVVAERSSYSGTVATSSSGTCSPWTIGEWPHWFAEGYSDFQHYIALQNLGCLEGEWRVDFISHGGIGSDFETIQPWARGTLEETCYGPGVNYASVRFAQINPAPGTSPQDCACERSSYYGQWGTSSEGVNF